MTTRGIRIALCAALVAAATACSSDDTATVGDDTPVDGTTTTTGTETPADFAERGPYGVGQLPLTLPDGRRAVIWYPSDDAAAGVEDTLQFDIAGLLNDDFQSKIPDDKRPLYEIRSTGNAPASEDGPFPVVLFSHGYAGFPEQSADLVTHIASWGMVVVAPDHVERSLGGMLGTAARNVDKSTDPEVLSAALDAVLAEAGREGSPIEGLLDADRVAVVGHSAGAGAAYLTAGRDDRIDAFISYSVGAQRLLEPTDGSDAPPKPAVPGMLMLGTIDETIPAESTRELYEALTAPKAIAEIEGAGHLVFSDICLIGRDEGGLVGLVEQIGLAELLPDDRLLRLASDGCQPDALDPAEAFAGIDHLSVSFLRWVFGADPEPVGFDDATLEAIGAAPVSVRSDLG